MSANTPESPLDVLSRAATMVEKSQVSPPLPELMDQSDDVHGVVNSSSRSSSLNNGHGNTGFERSPSFKERHPKFRKTSTPDYLLAADQARTVKLQRQTSASESVPPHVVMRHRTPTPPSAAGEHLPASHAPQDDSNEEINVDIVDDEEEEEEGPIDMSMKKPVDTPPPPPPYKFIPLRHPSETSAVGNLPMLPPPAYTPHLRPPPPPYPLSPSPPNNATISTTSAAKSENLPPPPSYESSTVTRAYACSSSLRNVYPDVSTTTKEKRKNRKQTGQKSTSHDDDRPIREITIITDSSADPLLDEHFRRSLGEKNYQSLFKKPEEGSDSPSMAVASPASVSPSSSSTSSSAKVSPQTGGTDARKKGEAADPVKAFHDDMEMAGCTVEDHFAKALGETWVKLQAKAEQEAKTRSNADKHAAEESSSKVSSSTEENPSLKAHGSLRIATVL